jgi:mycothiol synthase
VGRSVPRAGGLKGETGGVDELPAGHRVRRPRPADVPVIHELVAAVDTTVIGGPDTTAADITDELAEPGFDPERDGWLVHDAAGRLVGWGWACQKAGSENVDVDVYVRPDEEPVGAWLWRAVLRRADELAAGSGHTGAVVDAPVFRGDERKRAALAARGFTVATTFHRMRVDHSGPLPRPPAPPGVTLRAGPGDAALREAAHRVHHQAFAGHFGFVPRTFAEWADELESATTHDWRLLRLAAVDGVPAAMLLGNNQFVADENCGYIRVLGVLPAYRGRGLATYLLRSAFADDSHLGRAGTCLHVDANNSTPALDLYCRAGMRPVLVIDVWRRLSRLGDAATLLPG